MDSIFNKFCYIIISITFYFCWVLELRRIFKRIGSFKIKTILFYPIYLIFFTLVFFLSLFKKMFGFEAVWKGRKIKLD